MPTQSTWLPVRPLTAQAFAPFGEVIELESGGERVSINGGTSMRHHTLACPTAAAPGALALSLFDAAATPQPCALQCMERHHLGSQSFTPFGAALQMLVVVADARLLAGQLAPQHLRAFVSNGRQGINLHAGVWHHPLLSLQAGAWLVVDRIAAAVDCEVQPLAAWRLRCATR